MNEGAQNCIEVYPVVKLQTSGIDTSYQIQSTSWASGSVACTTHSPIFYFNEIEESAPTFQEDGTVKFNLEQYIHNPAFTTFLKLANPYKPVEKVYDIALEDGSHLTNASQNLSLLIFYGVLDTESNQVHTMAALGYFSRTSGSYKTKSGNPTKPTVEFIGLRSQWALPLATGLFNTAIITPSATLIAGILKRAGCVEDWCPAAF